MAEGSVAVFEQHRRLLVAMAYQIVGGAAEAEDVVQETWLRWDGADQDAIASPRAWLVRVATRLAIDRLRLASTRREQYVGPWLPEPLLTSPDVADEAELAESVSVAMLVVLETLSPLERAVFVLREAFGYSYAEIGEAIGRAEPAVRQLAHRAREHVQARRPRFQPDGAVRREVTERFLAASLGGDLDALMRVLAPDVTLWADGGGKVVAPRRPIHGTAEVARFLVGAAARDRGSGLEFSLTEANGGPAVLVTSAGTPVALFVVDVEADGDRVQAIYLVANPDKLGTLRSPGAGPQRSAGRSHPSS
jgi:RNA polymerase sigma-70 factor (ECF subfamily)